MMERNNRTWLCSVLFMDIVGYSKLAVDRQMAIKKHFCDIISRALDNMVKDECINLDTGDGMAICYLGDPEDILFAGMGLRDAFYQMQDCDPVCYEVRLGINLGPVKIVEDINGQRNTVGDGINVAQRVMNFAKANQLLVSRSYFDVVSCLSDEYPKMFHFLGLYEDKHVRKHGIYEVVSINDRVDTDTIQEEETLTTATQNIFDDTMLERTEKALAEFVGPMARILVRNASGKAGSNTELFNMLARDIPDAGGKKKFMDVTKKI